MIGCVTGRFQPVHLQHVALLHHALAACEHVIVAITNPDRAARRAEPTSEHRHTDAANPFTYFERARLVAAAVTERITIVPFDLTRPEHWADYVPRSARQYIGVHSAWERDKAARLSAAGYTVELVERDPATRISASDVRASLRAGDDRWRALVPPATVPLLEAMR